MRYYELSKKLKYLLLHYTEGTANISETPDIEDVVSGLKSLRVIEVDNIAKDYIKYKSFDYFLLLKNNRDFYLLDTTKDGSYKPLKINDFNIYLRKEKLDKLFDE